MTRTDIGTGTVEIGGMTTTATNVTIEYSSSSTGTAAYLGAYPRSQSSAPVMVPTPKTSRNKYRKFLKGKGFHVLVMEDCQMCKDSVWVAVEKDQRYMYWHTDFHTDGRRFIPKSGDSGSEIYKTSGELISRLEGSYAEDSGIDRMVEVLKEMFK